MSELLFDGNVAYATADIGLSIYGLSRMVIRPGAWRLFYYMPSDYVRAYVVASKSALSVEVGANLQSVGQIQKEIQR